MSSTAAGPGSRLRARRTLAGAAVGTAALTVAVAIGILSAQPGSSAAPSIGDVARDDRLGATTDDGVASEADGILPDGATVFDGQYAGIADLGSELLAALHAAATDAAEDGVTLHVNSGWRSAGYQDQLLRDAVAEHGSEAEAARWVATADTSPHVHGDAVDIARYDATAWLSEHGAAYGLCRIYENEPWHYELRPDAVDSGCPRMYPDPTYDPRMQQ